MDLAAVVQPHELRRALEKSVDLGLFDRNALARYATRRGINALRDMMGQVPDEPPPTRNELERRFLDLMRRAALPVPVVNAYVDEHEIDFHWPAHHLVVETDGREFHHSAIAFERDRRRDLDLELAGWHVLRIGWRQVFYDPGRVTELVRTRLARVSG